MHLNLKKSGQRVIVGSLLAAGIATAGLFTAVAPASAAAGPSDPQLACNYDRLWGHGEGYSTQPCQHYGPGWGYVVTNPHPGTPDSWYR